MFYRQNVIKYAEPSELFRYLRKCRKNKVNLVRQLTEQKGRNESFGPFIFVVGNLSFCIISA